MYVDCRYICIHSVFQKARPKNMTIRIKKCREKMIYNVVSELEHHLIYTKKKNKSIIFGCHAYVRI